MKKTIDGTVEEIIRQVFVQGIPLSARACLELETPDNAARSSPQEKTVGERLAAWQSYIVEHTASGRMISDNRAAIYAENEDHG
jgi:hypothetical protein